MPYKTGFRKRAIKEYLEAIGWYQERSLLSAGNFVLMVEQTIQKIKNQPHNLRKTYKNYHEVKIILLILSILLMRKKTL